MAALQHGHRLAEPESEGPGRPPVDEPGRARLPGSGLVPLRVEIPDVPTGKKAGLFCPAVVDQVWVWVNGKYAGRSDYVSCFSRPHEADIDITPYLQAGKNVIALRVLCNDEYFGANGLYERPFVYTRNQQPAK